MPEACQDFFVPQDIFFKKYFFPVKMQAIPSIQVFYPFSGNRKHSSQPSTCLLSATRKNGMFRSANRKETRWRLENLWVLTISGRGSLLTFFPDEPIS
ncbi:MAG: hypothetical protein R2830_11800 [Saprospiraceae bacterium]